VEKLNKSIKVFGQNSWTLGQESNWGLPGIKNRSASYSTYRFGYSLLVTILFENLTVAQLVKKHPAFYGA
jgi:hypothetical protein